MKCWTEIKELPNDFSGTTFYTPPENQGKIVDIAYAACNGEVYCSWKDKSDGEERLYWRWWKKSDGDCDFWNRAPEPTRVCGSDKKL